MFSKISNISYFFQVEKLVPNIVLNTASISSVLLSSVTFIITVLHFHCLFS